MDKKTKIWDYKSNKEDKLSKKVEKDENIVYTSDSMAKYLLSLVEFKDNYKIMEPCRGKGAFYNNLPQNVEKHYCEINEDKDYLNFNGKVDVTLSNPPFVPRTLFWDFHIKAMDTTTINIYWLINMSSLNVFTPKRLKEMEKREWYMENLHIVSDKRWFGRYVWVKFGRNKNKSCLNFTDKIF